MTIPFLQALLVRVPTLADLEAVADLIIACDLADTGKPDFSAEELREDWEREHFSLATDARVVVASAGQIIGYTDVCPRPPRGLFINPNTSVHPAYRGQGIERALYRFAEARARQYWAATGDDAFCRVWTISVKPASHRLLEEEGFTASLVETRLEIDLDEPPPAPTWPEGFQVRIFIPGVDEHAVHQVIQESFKDIGTREEVPFEDWVEHLLHREDFDP